MVRKSVDDAVATFHQDGFCVLPGLLGPETLVALNALTDHLLEEAVNVSGETDVYDLEADHCPEQPAVRRIKKPHDIDKVFRDAAEQSELLQYLKALMGPDIRLHHSKINTKQPHRGSALEWHQDWAFIPHTNQNLVIVSIMLDPVDDENGPMMVIPTSHRNGLLDHRNPDGDFTGAIDPDDPALELERAIALKGPSGTVTLHHPLLAHGAAANRSDRRRNVLFYEYAAADAWPLFYGVDWPEYTRRLICGNECNEPRLEPCFVRMGFPRPYEGSIYANQQAVRKRYF